MLQDEYRALYKKIKPGWQDSVSLYKKTVRPLLKKNTVVLEAGCGFSDLYQKEYKKVKKVIGVDIDPTFLDMNPYLDEKVPADLANMPQVQNDSVDLIISSWVFEHIKHPQG